MSGKFQRWLPVIIALAISVMAAGGVWAQEFLWNEAPTVSGSMSSGRSPATFAPLAKKSMPSVVTVYTKKEVKIPRLFMGVMPYTQEGAGSGFIISPDGYILTNHHVVRNSDSIKVLVGVDKKKEYDAKLVGTDADIDVALIKIEGEGLLPLTLGNSDLIEVGDWVAAIGSPFNFTHTFTVGVVSAKGRRLGIGNYDDFIQTDASINAGNSGGPLINMRGEVVGINTLIVSPTGGNVGIGFSTPIDLVKTILPQLKEAGKVTRSWLGVTIEPVSEEVAKAAGLDHPMGAHVVQLVINGPADKAGITVGDIIVKFNGLDIEDSHNLPAIVSSYGVGKKVSVTWVHDAKRMSKELVLEKLPDREEFGKLDTRGSASVDNILGLGVRDLNEDDRKAMAIGDVSGVLVAQVAGGSPAEQNDIRPGDVITKINLANIGNVEDFNKAVNSLKPGSYVRINVQRGNANIFRVFRLEK